MPQGAQRPGPLTVGGYDAWLLAAVVTLIGLGLIMVASASIGIAERRFDEPLHYFWRQLVALGLGIALAVAMARVPLATLQRASGMFLLLGAFLLALVIVPGLGREVNGSMRWLQIGTLSLQPSEPAKLCFVIYLAAYLVRHGEQVRTAFVGFIKPIGLLTVLGGLLLLEPDYGATVVLFVTALGMLFVGGVSLARFAAWGLVAVTALTTTAVLAPYRLERLMTFMNPWADPYDKGFQLTQALIAFGRGEWTGVGLGASVQKLFYLPEVHTDFIFAVIAEELGLAGTLTVIALFLFLIWRAFSLGARAEAAGLAFQAYLAYGIGFLLGLQAFTNIGVNMGVLPTKGLTLPLVSYGANSIVFTCMAVGLLVRAGYETDAVPPRVRAGGGRV
ncbi:MAG: putative lipid II flippase FtsW [Gammaproteobacteria bacterium]|nr:putative lipid II flippase FtsW [Gammaproteobacteria bacterium]